MALKDLVLPHADDPDVLIVLAELESLETGSDHEIEMMARRIVLAIWRRANQQKTMEGK